MAVIASCCLLIILALVGAVGLASGLEIRHVVQTLPLWLAIAVALRRSATVKWIALPLFAFWLILMALIWLFLLGLPSPVSGHFSLVEIGATLLVGVASIVGMYAARFPSGSSAWGAVTLLTLSLALQLICFRLSLLPSIAHR